MRLKFKKPRIRLEMPPRPDFRQVLLPVAVVIFLTMMTKLVVTQNQALEEPFAGEDMYVRFMLLLGGFAVAASLYSMVADANFVTLIAGTCIVFAVGTSYQFLFDGFNKYCYVGAASLAAAVVVYVVCRRFHDISDRWFHGIAIAIVVLLIFNRVFGKYADGAWLTVPIGSRDNPIFSLQPGEYVKVLTMILGACSYQNRKRSIIYCATTLFACVFLVGVINDLGNTMVIFVMFVLMTYLLFDNRRLSLSIIAAAAVCLVVLVFLKPHALSRFTNIFQAMNKRGDMPEQYGAIRGVLFGGFNGLGLKNCARTLGVNAIQHDAAMGGVTAVYGIGITTIAMMGYAVLAALPAYNRSVHPSGYLLLSQFSAYVFMQAALNLGGALDTLPFTGIVAPLISEGANQMICFCGLLGLAAAAIHPKVFWKE